MTKEELRAMKEQNKLIRELVLALQEIKEGKTLPF